MSEFEPLIGFAVVILFTGLVLFFSSKKIRVKYPPVFRKLKQANNIRHAIGLAVEDGTRLHISLGNSSVIDSSNSSALVALSTLNRIEQMTSTSDLPPMCTSGNGSMQILSRDIVSQNTLESNAVDMANPSLAQLPGITPYAYALGAMEAINDSGVSANVLIGNYGPEAGLICETARNNQTYSLAGSDSIVAQSVFFAASDDTLIGEEIYGLPAYLGASPAHQSSLRVQDIFRWIIVLILLGAVILKVFGLI